MRTSAPITDSAELAARALLRMVLARLGPREFAVQLWDGEQWPPEPEGPADFKLIFRSPNVVRSMFSDISSLSFGEAYIYGHLDVEGSLIDVFESGDRLLTIHYPAAEKLRLARWLWSIPVVKNPANGTFGGFARRNISTAPPNMFRKNVSMIISPKRSRCCDRVVSSSITRLCGHRA